MIKIPEEEQIVEDLQEIDSMQLVVQVIMVTVCTIAVINSDIHIHCSNIVFHFLLF